MIRIYVSYFKIKFLNEIQYKVAAIAGSCTQFVWAGMYIMLYTAFLKDGSASDFSVRQMTTYIWLQQAFFAFFNIWNIDKEIEEQCRLGDIATELVKPISLYSIWHAKSLAKKTAMVSLRALPILIVAMMPFLGQYQIMAPKSALSLVLSIIAMILSVLVMISFIMIMYGVILKTVTSNGIKTMFGLVMDFASGGLIPIPFMPGMYPHRIPSAALWRERFGIAICNGSSGYLRKPVCMYVNWNIHGTGSYPEPPQGWQRRMRLTARQNPLKGPCFLMASTAYCEQVGVKRHEGPIMGDMHF